MKFKLRFGSAGIWTAMGPMGVAATDSFTVERVVGQTEYAYQFIGLSEGAYSAIAVRWRHPDETLPAEERTAVLGVYLDDPTTNSMGLEIPNTAFQGPLPASFLLGAGSTGKDSISGLILRILRSFFQLAATDWGVLFALRV